jgi:hypothetical protein
MKFLVWLYFLRCLFFPVKHAPKLYLTKAGAAKLAEQWNCNRLSDQDWIRIERN